MLCMPRDIETVAADVREMRRAIAVEKGDAERWDLKYAAGGLIDIEFIAQFLQLVHAAEVPDILDTATAAVLDSAVRLGLLATEDFEVLPPGGLALPGPQPNPTAGAHRSVRSEDRQSEVSRTTLARAADVPDFPTLEAHLAETQARVRRSFVRILGGEP